MESFIKWFGGKSRLRSEIIPLIPAHKTYVEVFAGASWILFGKPPSPVEIINDIDDELINLYQVIKSDLDGFIRQLTDIPLSETLFNKWADESEARYTERVHGGTPNPAGNGIPDVDLACQTYYILMQSFNGNIGKRPTLATSANKQSGFVKFYRTEWNTIRRRLSEVTILSRDFEDVIKHFDSPETIFYLDPPYTCADESRRYYRYTFASCDHEKLRVCLSDIAGKFILSYDDVPEVRAWYTDSEVRKTSNGELLILNYEPPDTPFYRMEGIPKAPGVPSRYSWEISNCPYCQSRNVQQVSKRVSLPGGKRSSSPVGYVCLECDGLFK